MYTLFGRALLTAVHNYPRCVSLSYTPVTISNQPTAGFMFFYVKKVSAALKTNDHLVSRALFENKQI